MEFLIIFIVAPVVIGVGIAIYEWRKGRTLLAHDLNQAGAQTETDRELARVQERVVADTYLDMSR